MWTVERATPPVFVLTLGSADDKQAAVLTPSTDDRFDKSGADPRNGFGSTMESFQSGTGKFHGLNGLSAKRFEAVEATTRAQ